MSETTIRQNLRAARGPIREGRGAWSVWLLACITGGSCLAVSQPAAAQEIVVSGSSPGLAVGVVERAAPAGEVPPGDIQVPVSAWAPADATQIDLAIYFPARLEFRGAQLSADAIEAGWNVSLSDGGFREREEGFLTGKLVRPTREGVDSEGSLRELHLFDLDFRVYGPGESVDIDATLSEHLQVSLAPSTAPAGDGDPADEIPGGSAVSSISRAGEDGAPELAETHLTSGGVTLYYRDAVAVGSGEMTRREQSFAVPLRATLLDARSIIWVGVDYDELILRSLRPTGRLERGEAQLVDSAVIEGVGRSLLRLDLSRLGAAPILSDTLLDLEFHYDGQVAETTALRIVPTILSDEEAAVFPELLAGAAPPEGGGASSGARSVPGLIRFTDARFVRGNVDSSITLTGTAPRYGPEISDALQILDALFATGDLPCVEAADLDDDGSIDLSDAVRLLSYLFLSGEPPAGPFPEVGTDASDSFDFGCERPLPWFSSGRGF